jgi:uncharacterized protein (TIGR02996 family)
MSTEQALYQGVLDAPDDDAPRLVFADWLEEHGQPERAEFIRVQIEQEREPVLSPRWRELEKRSRALLKGRVKQWGRTVKGLFWEPKFRRGFVESVCITARSFVERAAELFSVHPLRSLRLTVGADVGTGLADRFRSPVLGRLRHLEVGGVLTPADVAALAESPYASGLTGLDFILWGPGRPSLRGVFHSERLSRVEALSLVGDHPSQQPTPVQELAASPLARQLVRLRVERRWVPEVARALVESPNLGNLRCLGLRAMWGAAGTGVQLAEMLAGSALLPRLHTLLLADDRSGGEDGTVRLAGSPGVAGLRVLDLSAYPVTDAGARALLESPHLGNLWWLGVRRGGLSLPMLRELQKRFGRHVGTASGL